MHPALRRNVYFVKEHVAFFKAANNYDIIDPETNQIVTPLPRGAAGHFSPSCCGSPTTSG